MKLFRLLSVGFLMSSLWATSACSLEDERDLCCGRNMMHYTFVYAGINKFHEVVSTMEYYLFDRDGIFLQMMEPYKGDLSYVSLESLSAGRYTLVGVANRKHYASPQGSLEKGLQCFQLAVDGWMDKQRVFGTGDPMYWSFADFEIVEGERRMFVSSMNHIHCTLHIKIEWEYIPPYLDGYYFTLTGVGHTVAMHQKGALHYGGFVFPVVDYAQNIAYVKATMRQMILEEQIISLRYADGEIPVFRLWHRNRPVIPPIDLGKVFRQWGWYPNEATMQNYKIRLRIRSDGKIEIHQGLGASVNDWIDGGVIEF